MERIKLSFTGDIPSIDKPLSWGIHKELSTYLMEDGRLLSIFSDNDITENILQICLSERDTYGEVVSPFTNINNLDPKEMIEFLKEIHEYFENFFFQNQQRNLKMNQKFQELQEAQATKA